MAELTLRQIADKLNTVFASDRRQLVFWYDDRAEFEDEIESLELKGAKLLKLEEGCQIKTKYFLEYEDKTTSYLIYAPFPKPELYENHLADMILYSKEFSADRTSLICSELGIPEDLKHVIARFPKFFAAKDRFARFADLGTDNYTQESIITGLLCAVCRTKICSFEEAVRTVICEDLDDNQFITEFENYGLLDEFWKMAESYFGYSHPRRSLKTLAASMFLTYASKVISARMPKQTEPFISYKTGSMIAFLDNMMNSALYSERFDSLSHSVLESVEGIKFLEGFPVETLRECYIFSEADRLIIRWITARLENEDRGAALGGAGILQLCEERVKHHFGKMYKNEYCMLKNAFNIIASEKYSCTGDINKTAEKYAADFYKLDWYYRGFYCYYDRIEDSTEFEKIKEIAENIYTTDYLDKITADWSEEFVRSDGETGLLKQSDFWNRCVSTIKERTAVIISDGMRFETGQELYTKLSADEKCRVTISAVQSVLPSVTSFGMAALLPHTSLELSENDAVLADGLPTQTTAQRENILKSYNQNAVCLQFDSLKSMKTNDIKSLTVGQEVLYIYHNQIDARGDKAVTENEVFDACSEAVCEIAAMVRKLTSCNVTRFLITSDHGFLYRRNTPGAAGRINDAARGAECSSKRYIISDDPVRADGVKSIHLGTVLGSNDKRFVSFPLASDIFSVQGSGLNYVHGGCSPQEMIIPLLDVKTMKSKVETSFAVIESIMLSNKITNLKFNIDFLQSQKVSDTVKPCDYRIYIRSESGEHISNEQIYAADSTEENSADRRFRFTFILKNRLYSINEKYYLIIFDDTNSVELSSKEIVIDIPFANDFGL